MLAFNLHRIGISPSRYSKIVLLSFILSGSASAAMCVANPVANSQLPPELLNLPRITISDFKYAGAFRFPANEFGTSSMHAASGVMKSVGDTMYVVGKATQQNVAEFKMPELVKSDNILELNTAASPTQDFVRFLNKAESGNPENIDFINGIEEYNGKLIVNAHTYYDGAADNKDTTLVLSDSSDIANSSVTGYLQFPNGPKSAGWIAQIPQEWRSALQGDYLTGFGQGTAILTRHTIGPSAHAFYMSDLLGASIESPKIATRQLLEFSLSQPLADDLYNESKTNDLWTIATAAWYGFIIPGTRTYATFGSLEGAESGLGYKITQDNGNNCNGYCPYQSSDESPYYWLWDVADLVAVNRGEMEPYAVRPYEYGVFPITLQSGDGANLISGGSYDFETNRLYLMLNRADRVSQYDRPPITVAYDIDS